jgi:hypothetical protein
MHAEEKRMMKRIGYTQLVIGLLLGALVIGIVVVRVESGGTALNQRPARAAGADLKDEYAGQVALEGVFSGVFNDTVEPNAIDLGYIDLALVLEGAGGAVSGYVSLERTLVFTGEHEMDGKAVGPLLSGTFDGTTLRLTSEKFTRVLSERRLLPEDGRILPERRVMRQFRLVSTEVQTDGIRLEGEYRETVWGLLPQPVTVVGTFGLNQVAPVLEFEDIYMPLVLKRY